MRVHNSQDCILRHTHTLSGSSHHSNCQITWKKSVRRKLVEFSLMDELLAQTEIFFNHVRLTKNLEAVWRQLLKLELTSKRTNFDPV